MKTIIYLSLSFLLSGALFHYQTNGLPLWFCFVAGFAIVALCWVGIRSLKTGGKKGDIAY